MKTTRQAVCVGCVYANWDCTSAGRLHPSGLGRCTYEVVLPGSVQTKLSNMHKSHIHRATGKHDGWPLECRVREE